MREHTDHRWGDYYLSGGRKGKKAWALELIHTINQMIPTFNELFDEETFYVFAIIVVVSSFLIAFFLAKVVGVRLREYPLNVDREWRNAEPANPFRFPWNKDNLMHQRKNDFREEFQKQVIKRLLKYEDVIVQAPTGSGKTLAYVLPVFTILRKKNAWLEREVGALIIVPSRELAKQVGSVCKPFADALSFSMHVMIGGKKGKQDLKSCKFLNATLIIATPGRLQSVISTNADFKKALKSLEILIIDEADRYEDTSFKSNITEILESFPKQRRTGLFSATQAKEVGDVVKFGLRNPVQITLSNTGLAVDSVDIVSPKTLNNYYMIVEADKKLHSLIEFIRNHQKSKILIFFSTCQCVEYMQIVLKHFIQQRQIFALHGRKKKKVENELENFRKIGKSLMLCTDVLSRGVDVNNIDWVVQFDIPKQTSWFVHRAGRSGRCGREGNNVLFITPEETAYIDFIQNYEKVILTKMKTNWKTDSDGAEQMRQELVKLASSEREILESGTRAFMSFVESYVHHDCNVVCSYKDLNITGYGHTYGLLRLPRMKEFRQKDLSDFRRSNLDTAKIPYKNVHKERRRQERLSQGKQEKKHLVKNDEVSLEAISKNMSTDNVKLKKFSKKRRYCEIKEDNDNFGSDFALLKKMKKGRLKKKEFDELMAGSS
ncbi:unnamed protein product [Thelazia callipaeda]|uniref:ATP-dependent RNA helicase n=1 Tax=Thelazia callipaeda TaxID=103827 RepID=A0A0N5CZG8_THECL|nr:unnamed protein product [Thelazia callipaeda]